MELEKNWYFFNDYYEYFITIISTMTDLIQTKNDGGEQSVNTDFLALFWSTTDLIIEKGCPFNNLWRYVGRIQPNRSWFSGAVLNGRLILVGGQSNILVNDVIHTESVNTVQSFDLENLSLNELGSLLTPRHDVGVAVLEGKLYAVGGNTDGNALGTVECYDPTRNIWEYVAPMNVPRDKVGVAVLNGLLYAVGGGNNDTQFLRSTERYNPHTNEWTTLADMNEGRYLPGVAAGNGQLVAVGGFKYGNLNTAEAYDVGRNAWFRINSLSQPRRSVGCVRYNNRMIAFGGFRSNFVDEFNFHDQVWIPCKPLHAVDDWKVTYPSVNKWFHLLIPTCEIV